MKMTKERNLHVQMGNGKQQKTTTVHKDNHSSQRQQNKEICIYKWTKANKKTQPQFTKTTKQRHLQMDTGKQEETTTVQKENNPTTQDMLGN